MRTATERPQRKTQDYDVMVTHGASTCQASK